jgi:hypothetical protein
MVLQSTIESISKIKERATGSNLEAKIKSPLQHTSSSTLHDFLVTGLVELCKVKPVGIEAVKWLGQWIIENNPNKPAVFSVDDE